MSLRKTLYACCRECVYVHISLTEVGDPLLKAFLYTGRPTGAVLGRQSPSSEQRQYQYGRR